MAESQPSFLYVEDDLLSREVLGTIFTKILNYSDLTFFENSENFLKRMAAMPKVPDVIFLDIHIRPNNGYELLEWLRADSTYKNTKIIALTASVMVHDVAQLQKAGFDGLIGKPIAHKIFPRLLESILADEPVWYIP
jgi:CheY-like chemotaxis protein